MGSKNRTKILNAVMKLGNCYPYEIKNFLDEEARRLIQSQYQNTFVSINKKIELEKKETMSERAIFGWLNQLKKQGLLIHEDNKYRLSNQVSSDVEFTAGLFGLNILSSLLPPPTDTNKDDRLIEIVNCFGVFMVYTLMQCLQPLQNTNYNNDKNKLEDFRKTWVNTTISPEYMLILLREQLGLIKFSKSNGKMQFHELGQDRYEKLLHYLKGKYPSAFNKINQGIDNMYNMIKSKTDSSDEQ